MKPKLLFILLIASVFCAIVSFKPEPNAPKLYPELEAYFRGLNTKKIDGAKASSLNTIRENINYSDMDFTAWNCVFLCTENTFRSQASQVLLETLCYAKRHRNTRVHSAGVISGEINLKLIAYLIKIGYRISTKEGSAKNIYEVRYSDNSQPIILYSKNIEDKSLPKNDITSIVVCNRAIEMTCKNLQPIGVSVELPFENVSTEDSEEKVASTVDSIAVSMQYATERKAIK